MSEDTFVIVRRILAETLSFNDREDELTRDALLLGNIPEFDSMAVVAVITAIEENFGLVIEDDDIDAETFESVGSLTAFVEERL